MKTCGIIAEYNPFHHGHRYQIEKTKEKENIDVIIAVMSGNFVQRGEPAIIDKWKRAEEAIHQGIDVVIELPYLYATQSASRFAFGAISLLKLANVDYISFGSECANLENLKEIASTSIQPDNLHELLNNGTSYPKAYSLLTHAMEPNDILAVAYLKELNNTNIEPILIPRTSPYLGEELAEYSSALSIRKAKKEDKDVKIATDMDLPKEDLAFMEAYYPYLRTYLLTSSREHLNKTFLFSEGIEKHLYNCALEHSTFEDFLNSATTYRYTSSRIKRTCLQALNQVTKKEVEELPTLDTLRILAFNDNGRKWLHAKKKEDIHFASKFSDIPYPWRQLEYRTTLLYSSIFHEERRKYLLDREIKGAEYIKK